MTGAGRAVLPTFPQGKKVETAGIACRLPNQQRNKTQKSKPETNTRSRGDSNVGSPSSCSTKGDRTTESFKPASTTVSISFTQALNAGARICNSPRQGGAGEGGERAKVKLSHDTSHPKHLLPPHSRLINRRNSSVASRSPPCLSSFSPEKKIVQLRVVVAYTPTTAK